MEIGTVKIDSRLALAPMAGVTDAAFRQVCAELGAGLTYTELVSAKALCYQDKKTLPLLELGESGDGSFTAVLRIQNLTDQPLELTVDAQVLTDAWTEENGRTYSALTALDITDRVEISGDKTVALPAGGSGEDSFFQTQLSREPGILATRARTPRRSVVLGSPACARGSPELSPRPARSAAPAGPSVL